VQDHLLLLTDPAEALQKVMDEVLWQEYDGIVSGAQGRVCVCVGGGGDAGGGSILSDGQGGWAGEGLDWLQVGPGREYDSIVRGEGGRDLNSTALTDLLRLWLTSNTMGTLACHLLVFEVALGPQYCIGFNTAA
jgi:hypothetical protein